MTIITITILLIGRFHVHTVTSTSFDETVSSKPAETKYAGNRNSLYLHIIRYYLHSRSFLQIKCRMKCGTEIFFFCYSFSTSLFIFVTLVTQNTSILQWQKKGTKLLHHIWYKCFNFPCFLLCNKFISVTTKNQTQCSDFVFALPANMCVCVCVCTQFIVNQQRNYDWAHRLLL